jgi:hypothetical protein
MNDTILNERCGNCKHWKGDREELLKILSNVYNIAAFMDLEHTLANYGECFTLRAEVCGMPYVNEVETSGVFGCKLYSARD